MKNINFSFLVIVFSLLCLNCFSQDLGRIKGTNVRHFQLKDKKDSIDFIIVNDELTKIKPILLFLQGSYPIPLIIKFYSGTENEAKVISSVSHFNYNEIAKNFHLVIISMPKTPVEVEQERLGSYSAMVVDKNKYNDFTKSYLKDSYLENYVLRTKKVINYLNKQRWVLKNKTVIFGHSQGAKIALETSVNNAKIYKIGFSSGDIMGRMDHMVRKERYDALLGLKSQEDAQKYIYDYYGIWQEVIANPKSSENRWSELNKNWISFNRPLINDFLKIKQPIYVCYGTQDERSVMCDVLPFYFISKGKRNLTIKPYPGRDHNYSLVNKENKPIENTMIWQNVIDDFVKWARK